MATTKEARKRAQAAAAAEEKSDKAVAAVRPLNATQSRTLGKLVAADFQSVRTELNDQIRAAAQRAKEEVEKEWADRNGTAVEWKDKAIKLLTEQSKARDALIREAAAANVQLNLRTGAPYAPDVIAEVVGLKEAVYKATNAVHERGRDAMNALERAEIAAQRKVFVASITVQAEEILASIPDAKTLLAEQKIGVQDTRAIAK